MHQLQGARTRRNAYSFGSLDYTSGRVTCPGIARSSYAALVLCLTLPGSIQRYADSLDNYISAPRRSEALMGINKDQVEGRVKEAAGKVQEVAGRTVGSPTQEAKGVLNKTAGAAQAKLGDAKKVVKDSFKRR